MSRLKLPILLVITESPPVRYWIKKQLDSQFFIIDADSRTNAIITVQTSHLDFVILDANLEECDAIELCKTIRAKTPNDFFPILLITGRLKKTYRDHALESGVNDFLSDRLDAEELETRIAIGLKTAEVREKVSALSNTIPTPPSKPFINYFKNRVLLHEQAIKYLDDAHQKNSPVTMMMARIDGFEELQAKYGLTMAYEMLIQVSELFKNSVRKKDMMVTPSSDGQFIGLLSNITEQESKKIAETIQTKINEGVFKLTASFAIGKVDSNETSFNKTINAAKIALKKSSAKKNIIFSLDQTLQG